MYKRIILNNEEHSYNKLVVKYPFQVNRHDTKDRYFVDILADYLKENVTNIDVKNHVLYIDIAYNQREVII